MALLVSDLYFLHLSLVKSPGGNFVSPVSLLVKLFYWYIVVPSASLPGVRLVITAQSFCR